MSTHSWFSWDPLKHMWERGFNEVRRLMRPHQWVSTSLTYTTLHSGVIPISRSAIAIGQMPTQRCILLFPSAAFRLNVYLSSDSTHCAPSVCGCRPTTTQEFVCECVWVYELAYMGCVKSWGVCLQCWEPHLHTHMYRVPVQFRLTQLSWRFSYRLLMDRSQTNVSFTLNLIIDSEERKMFENHVSGKWLYVCQFL